jgi:predicted CopG family antitoxin
MTKTIRVKDHVYEMIEKWKNPDLNSDEYETFSDAIESLENDYQIQSMRARQYFNEIQELKRKIKHLETYYKGPSGPNIYGNE